MAQVVKIFVSHISEEAEMAALLKRSLEKDFVGFVELFTSSDAVSIRISEDWLEAIRSAMTEAAAVIVLCSKASIQKPWVQFELGAAWIGKVPIIPVCHSGLRVVDLPEPLSRLQGLELGTLRGISQLYGKLSELLEMKQALEPRDAAGLLAKVVALATTCPHGQLQQFERYIDIVLQPGQLVDGKIAADAVIESDPGSLELLFDLLPGTTHTWRDIVEAAERGRDRRWIGQLEQCIQLAARNRAFRAVQAIYHTRQCAYQPQLARKEMLPCGATRFHVHFIDTVVAPLFDVPNNIGTLATLLRLGLRFRYEVIEKFRYLEEACVQDAQPAQVQAETLKQLRAAIEVIETDAQSRGAENLDINTVLSLFANRADRAEMSRLDKEWNAARALVFRPEAAPTAQELCDAMRRMRALNYSFMTTGTTRFNELVRTCWDDDLQ